MKRLLCLLSCLICLGVYVPGQAEEVGLSSVYASISFPDDWLALTPASIHIYTAILTEAGLDAQDMALRYQADGVAIEGWSPDYADSLRLFVREDARSGLLFDIERASAAQRKGILNTFLDKTEWRLTNIRYQEGKWLKHPKLGYCLFLRYNVIDGEAAVERGVQYFILRNGRNYILDWAIKGRRFTNKDLAWFRQRLDGFSLTEILPTPPLPVTLSMEGGLPTESGDGKLRLTGKASSQAGLVLYAAAPEAEPQVLSVGSANREGVFILNAQLPAEGEYLLTLVATKEGMADTQLTSRLTFRKGLLPINFAYLPEETYTEDQLVIEGIAPQGTVIQFTDPKGNRSAKVGTSGRFTFTVDTYVEGPYALSFSATNVRYDYRRIDMAFNRVVTEEQQLERMKAGAARLSYGALTKAENLDTTVRLDVSIIEESQGEGISFIRVYTVKDKKGWRNEAILVVDSFQGLIPGQEGVCYGRVAQPFTLQNAGGGDYLVPAIEVIHLDL